VSQVSHVTIKMTEWGWSMYNTSQMTHDPAVGLILHSDARPGPSPYHLVEFASKNGWPYTVVKSPNDSGQKPRGR
jgi:hypothetical protein